jgi:cell pole-organizing protein PopZ
MGSASLKINEPSMEDILASIRRIVAEDEAISAEEAEETASSPLRTVLDLTERHVSPDPVSEISAAKTILENGHVSRHDDLHAEDYFPHAATDYEAGVVAPQPVMASRPAPKPEPEVVAGEALISGQAQSSVSDAFSRLSASVPPSQPQTVEDLMKEMLRPMLKAWLDDNLPVLVERLVQAEIERVARRRA